MKSLQRDALVDRLQTYPHFFAEERLAVPRFLKLLAHPDAYQRMHLPGHITGSAWIVDEARQHTVLVHHAKLNIWVQPGGHADGEDDVLAVALREAEEETGLRQLTIVPDFSISTFTRFRRGLSSASMITTTCAFCSRQMLATRLPLAKNRMTSDGLALPTSKSLRKSGRSCVCLTSFQLWA